MWHSGDTTRWPLDVDYGGEFGSTLIGIAIGIASSLILARSLASMLYGRRATDPFTLLGVSLLLQFVVRCVLHSRTTSDVMNPVAALRCE